jgi:hypothetical protein
MARRYDEWPGEDYSGSSARGAMKGWFQHGVCSEEAWPKSSGVLDATRSKDALLRPLGAYFRVDHTDLVAMHAALAEVGALYATAQVHGGWREPHADGAIPLRDDVIGGHAFAIVGFDRDGFWIQNSWGATWGAGGFGRISYQDWLRNGTDVWVARLGVPVSLESTVGAASNATFSVAHATPEVETQQLRPHIISLGNGGRLQPNGPFGNTLADVQQILANDFPRLTHGWGKPRMMLFAHGGLNDAATAIERTKRYRELFLPREIYPLCVMWNTDLYSIVQDMLENRLEPLRPQGFLDDTADFMFDRFDDTLEPIARAGGKGIWDQLKDNATAASADAEGGLHKLIPLLPPDAELHLVGHSAGGNLHAAFAAALARAGRTIETCTLWAPACTVDAFEKSFRRLLAAESIRRFCLYTLTDKAEQDDLCGAYHKSLLYLVSNALEDIPHIPWLSEGEPLLGLEKYAARLKDFFAAGRVDWVVAPNNRSGTREAAQSKHHGDFDNDPDTIESTISRILNAPAALPAHESAPTPTRAKTQRRRELTEQMHWTRPK